MLNLTHSICCDLLAAYTYMSCYLRISRSSYANSLLSCCLPYDDFVTAILPLHDQRGNLDVQMVLAAAAIGSALHKVVWMTVKSLSATTIDTRNAECMCCNRSLYIKTFLLCLLVLLRDYFFHVTYVLRFSFLGRE